MLIPAMHFHFAMDELPKEVLDTITDTVVRHCADTHCTCDPCVHLGPEVVVPDVEGELWVALAGVSVTHRETCYSCGRNN